LGVGSLKFSKPGSSFNMLSTAPLSAASSRSRRRNSLLLSRFACTSSRSFLRRSSDRTFGMFAAISFGSKDFIVLMGRVTSRSAPPRSGSILFSTESLMLMSMSVIT
jgi:hypothetical protein